MGGDKTFQFIIPQARVGIEEIQLRQQVRGVKFLAMTNLRQLQGTKGNRHLIEILRGRHIIIGPFNNIIFIYECL
jgi:hypothetical protein